MKKLIVLSIITALFLVFACERDRQSERFKLLTDHVWTSDSLLADGEDASGPGQLLEKFKGDAKFNRDGTGYFGIYQGTWGFAQNETEIIIITNELNVPLSTKIVELTKTSLKITTGFPGPSGNIYIRMTFLAK